ncbi:MAG: hypothetical protein M1821_007384 [Bathelium mastoideum]|nr:MAG: hypothetical protein M1821_007384 [Bathelium mastoideum]
MTSATLVILDFEESLDRPAEVGNNRAILDETINLILEDVNCHFLFKGSVLEGRRKVALLIGWTTNSCTPSLESLLPYLASLPSARHLHFPTSLDALTAAESPIASDIHTLRLPHASSSLSGPAKSPSPAAAAELRSRIESLKLNPYISGNPKHRRSIVAHMPTQAGTQAFQGCYRTWSQSAKLTHEQEAAAQAGASDDADDEDYVLLVHWRDRRSAEAFKDPTLETENLRSDIWYTHFVADLDQLEDDGVARCEFRVDWERVPRSTRGPTRPSSQALQQLSRSRSLSSARSRSRSSASADISRSSSLRERPRSRSSYGQDGALSSNDDESPQRQQQQQQQRASFDARERSTSLGERRPSIGEVRDNEVGRAVAQRQSLSLRNLSHFQFEAGSDDDDSEEGYSDSDDGDGDNSGALRQGEAAAAGRERKDSGAGLSQKSSGLLGEIREEEEDEAGELRESDRGPAAAPAEHPAPVAAASQPVASARAKLEGDAPTSEAREEERGPIPMRGSLVEEARQSIRPGSGVGIGRSRSQWQKRYSSLLNKDEEEKQEEPKGLGLSRTKTLPMQARDSLKMELSKSKLERMGSIHAR